MEEEKVKEKKEDGKVRLQKFLADCGIASRRKCEDYILNGKISVNGVLVTKLGTKVDPKQDLVMYEQQLVTPEQGGNVYILLNKPIGYVTTVEDQFGRPTVMDLIRKVKVRVVPVGRLDMYTSGALILTNDGDFTYIVTHPKHEIEKTYLVTVAGLVTKDEANKLATGVQIDSYITKPARVKIIKVDEEKKQSRLAITIHEGKNRQVRRMCEAINKTVISLHRSKIGNISVRDLPLGEWRHLTKAEVNELKKA